MRTLACLLLLLASLTPVGANYGTSPYSHMHYPPYGTRRDPDLEPKPKPKPKKPLDLKIIDTAKCKPLGFGEGIGPACSDCEALFEFVKDEDPASATQLLEECRECCFIDRDPNIKFDRCELLVDRFALMYGQHGGVREFIEDHAKPYLANGRLEIRFVNGQRTEQPEMRFYDGDVEHPEERVMLWLAKQPGWGWESIQKYVEGKTKSGPEADKVRADYKAGIKPKKARRKKRKAKAKEGGGTKKKKGGFSSIFSGRDEL